jgi:uncharacterized membrane protein YccF (DUF307 family)
MTSPPPAAPQPPSVAVASPVAPGRTGPLRVIGNIIWLVFAGVWMAALYFVVGLIQCVTIIGIPFGLQSFKLAVYALWPFGRVVVQRTDRDPGLSCLGDILWLLLGGLQLALAHVATGLLLCLTIIGIPFGIASFKLAGLALMPFGKTIVNAGAPLPPNTTVFLSV